jgi:hypothetical protein
MSVCVASAGRTVGDVPFRTVGDVPFLSLTGVARLLHGFRLARSCQDALKEIAKILEKEKVNYMVRISKLL